MRQRVAAFPAVFLLLFAIGCAQLGFNPERIAQAKTAESKLFAAQTEYGKLLIHANAFKAENPTSPAVGVFRDVDLRVQRYERLTQEAIARGAGDEALTNIELMLTVVRELRNELVILGILEAVSQ